MQLCNFHFYKIYKIRENREIRAYKYPPDPPVRIYTRVRARESYISRKVQKMTESKIEARLVQGVKKRGGLCLKWVSPGCTGVPDRIVILPGGGVCFVELKQRRGKLSPRQRLIGQRLEEMGAEVRCLWSEEAVDAFLREIESV